MVGGRREIPAKVGQGELFWALKETIESSGAQGEKLGQLLKEAHILPG